MVRIYTKTGDKGETSLFTGQRVPKNDPFIEALGTVDECNSAIGAALSHLPEGSLYDVTHRQLTVIQHALFDIGAAIATPRTRAKSGKIEKTRFDNESIELLEQWIDEMERELPSLKTFILPGGHPSGAVLHLARSICRRLERLTTPLNHNRDVSDRVMKYLNRLSDYLFMTSRYINFLLKTPETRWEQHMAKDTEKPLP